MAALHWPLGDRAAEGRLRRRGRAQKVHDGAARHAHVERLAVPAVALGGPAGRGKSTTLRTVVQHLRLLFQQEGVDATVELTAYTGVAAFNIGFGARTARSSSHVSPNAAWKSELSGDALRKLEQQWCRVALLVVERRTDDRVPGRRPKQALELRGAWWWHPK